MKHYMKIGIMAAVMIMVIFLTACGSDADVVLEDEGSDGLPPVAVVKAREALAAHLGIGVEEIPWGSHERADWTDSCLGLGGPAESCLAAIHPGWKVMFEVDGASYEVRTDELGDIIRVKDE